MSAQALQQAIDFVAEYARFPEFLQITTEPVEGTSRAVVTFGGEQMEVDVAWALGNVRRLADRCSPAQMAEALRLSHPDRKGVGPKYPAAPRG